MTSPDKRVGMGTISASDVNAVQKSRVPEEIRIAMSLEERVWQLDHTTVSGLLHQVESIEKHRSAIVQVLRRDIGTIRAGLENMHATQDMSAKPIAEIKTFVNEIAERYIGQTVVKKMSGIDSSNAPEAVWLSHIEDKSCAAAAFLEGASNLSSVLKAVKDDYHDLKFITDELLFKDQPGKHMPSVREVREDTMPKKDRVLRYLLNVEQDRHESQQLAVTTSRTASVEKSLSYFAQLLGVSEEKLLSMTSDQLAGCASKFTDIAERMDFESVINTIEEIPIWDELRKGVALTAKKDPSTYCRRFRKLHDIVLLASMRKVLIDEERMNPRTGQDAWEPLYVHGRSLPKEQAHNGWSVHRPVIRDTSNHFMSSGSQFSLCVSGVSGIIGALRPYVSESDLDCVRESLSIPNIERIEDPPKPVIAEAKKRVDQDRRAMRRNLGIIGASLAVTGLSIAGIWHALSRPSGTPVARTTIPPVVKPGDTPEKDPFEGVSEEQYEAERQAALLAEIANLPPPDMPPFEPSYPLSLNDRVDEGRAVAPEAFRDEYGRSDFDVNPFDPDQSTPSFGAEESVQRSSMLERRETARELSAVLSVEPAISVPRRSVDVPLPSIDAAASIQPSPPQLTVPPTDMIAQRALVEAEVKGAAAEKAAAELDQKIAHEKEAAAKLAAEQERARVEAGRRAQAEIARIAERIKILNSEIESLLRIIEDPNASLDAQEKALNEADSKMEELKKLEQKAKK